MERFWDSSSQVSTRMQFLFKEFNVHVRLVDRSSIQLKSFVSLLERCEQALKIPGSRFQSETLGDTRQHKSLQKTYLIHIWRLRFILLRWSIYKPWKGLYKMWNFCSRGGMVSPWTEAVCDFHLPVATSESNKRDEWHSQLGKHIGHYIVPQHHNISTEYQDCCVSLIEVMRLFVTCN